MKIIKLAGRDDYLKSLGVAEDVVAYVMSLPDKESIYLTNALRKAPLMSVEDLKGVQMPNQPFPIQEYERESFRVSAPLDLSPRMTDWFIMQIRKRIPGELTLLKDNRPVSGTLVEEEKYKAFKIVYLNRFSSELASLSRVGFWDWYRMAPDRDLTGGTLDDALRMNEEWHDSFKGKEGAGQYRESNVVYGPQWGENEKWTGWTIREITTENDITVEGDEMGHCCGSYWNEEMGYITGSDGGKSRIFSLRDPSNKPHVTIETNEIGDTAYQLQGKENEVPDDSYAEMIKHWVLEGGSPMKEMEDEGVEEPSSGNLTYLMDELDELERRISGDRYGLKQSIDNLASTFSNVFEAGVEAVSTYNDRGGAYGDKNFPETLTDLMVRFLEDDEIRFFINDDLIKFSDESWDDFQTHFDIPYPDEGDAEAMKEYEWQEEYYSEQNSQIQLSKYMFDGFRSALEEHKGVKKDGPMQNKNENFWKWVHSEEAVTEGAVTASWYENYMGLKK